MAFPSLSGRRNDATSNIGRSVTMLGMLPCTHYEQTCQTLGVSIDVAVQAAWAAILFSYQGTSVRDIVFAYRREREATRKGQTAKALKTYPIRVQLPLTSSDGILTNHDILNSLYIIDNGKTEIYTENNYPGSEFDDMYDTIVILHSGPSGPTFSSSSDDESGNVQKAGSVVAVDIFLSETGPLEFSATFTNRHLSDEAALLMLQQLDGVMRCIIASPDQPFSAATRYLARKLKAISNPQPSQPNYDDLLLLHSQFEKHAHSHPEDRAFQFVTEQLDGHLTSEEWSYGNLNVVATALAGGLSHDFDGDLQNTIIPLVIEKKPELYIAILAVLKLGAAFCPVDPMSPASRQQDLIARCQPKLILVGENLKERISSFPLDQESTPSEVLEPYQDSYEYIFGAVKQPVAVKVVESSITIYQKMHYGRTNQFASSAMSATYAYWELERTSGNTTSSTAANPSMAIAYLIWTSGTTGPPKGVAVSHRAASSSMISLQETIPYKKACPPVHCIQFSQPTFDVFIQDLFYTWGVGGKVISASQDLMIRSFAKIAEFSSATHAHLTPAFAGSVPRASCPSLRIVTMIGEALPQHVADDWSSGSIQAFNTYGPAEAAIVSTVKEFSHADRRKSSNIGRPLPSVSCYVIQNDHIAIANSLGELALGGLQLAKGYLGDTEKTMSKFKWNEEAGERLYFTGDLVRQLADGTFEFVGREDDLVKIQGIRVELSEISFALKGCHPHAEQIETCFFSRPDRPAKVLVTFVSAPHSGTGSSNGLETQGKESTERRFQEYTVVKPSTRTLQSPKAIEVARATITVAREKLPDMMVPRLVIVLSQIPRTTSAKADIRVLQSLYSKLDINSWEGLLHSGTTFDKSSNSTEENYALEVIASIAGVPLLSLKSVSYLPALGVDSIASGKLSKALSIAGYDVDVPQILRCRTVGDLLQSIKFSHKKDLAANNFASEL